LLDSMPVTTLEPGLGHGSSPLVPGWDPCSTIPADPERPTTVS